MKICIVSQTFAPQEEGGAEISCRHAAQNLASRGHDIVVLALGHKDIPDAPLGECLTDAPWRLYRVAFHNAYLPGPRRPNVGLIHKAIWHLKNALGSVASADLRRFFRDEEFDLIYAHNSTKMQPALFDVATELAIPVCQHLHDYAFMCPRSSMYTGKKNCEHPCGRCRLLTYRARKSIGSVRTVIAVSNFVSQRFQRHGLFSGCDFHVLHNTNTVRADFDGTLLSARPATEPTFTFGYLGALSEEKGVESLIDAFSSLPDSMPVRLLIAGRGHTDFISAMQARTARLPEGRVEWLGHVRPEIVYSRSEVILFPSIWHEPQSRVLVEAATYGIPVIAASSGGTPEFVEGNRTGWCYAPGESVELARLMANAAQHGAAAWRSHLPSLFPGLAAFDGTAEGTAYYDQLEDILTLAAKSLK